MGYKKKSGILRKITGKFLRSLQLGKVFGEIHHKIFWQFDPHNSTWITWKHVDFHTFPYTLHRSMMNHVDFCGSMLCGSSQGIWKALESLGKPWNYSDFHRFPWFTMWISLLWIFYGKKFLMPYLLNLKEVLWLNIWNVSAGECEI